MKWLLALLTILTGAAYVRGRSIESAQLIDTSDDASWAPLDTLNAGVQAVTADLRAAAIGSPVDAMSTSWAMRDRLKQREGLRLQRYRLGDGGWTIGYGRYYPDGGELPPETISQAVANAWFDIDLVERGERWVKQYVTAPVTQAQFDALVSMAYNLRPSSFARIAAEVNAGRDPEAVALQYVRAGTHLERGLRNRRAEEIAIYRGTLEA